MILIAVNCKPAFESSFSLFNTFNIFINIILITLVGFKCLRDSSQVIVS